MHGIPYKYRKYIIGFIYYMEPLNDYYFHYNTILRATVQLIILYEIMNYILN